MIVGKHLAVIRPGTDRNFPPCIKRPKLSGKYFGAAVCMSASAMWCYCCLSVRYLERISRSPSFHSGRSPVRRAQFPAPPREQRQLLARARRAIDDREYSAAVEMLFGLLQHPDAEDFFLETDGKEMANQSIKRQAQEMLGSMPAAGRDILELKLGKDAERDLDRAISGTDMEAVRQVARRYFHTQAGYRAAYLLARDELDRHRALAATLYFKRLREAAGAPHSNPNSRCCTPSACETLGSQKPLGRCSTTCETACPKWNFK